MKYILYSLGNRLSRKRKIGNSKNIFIARRVQMHGLNNIYIGNNCVIGEGTTLTVNNRNISEKTLIIGNNSYIGRNNFIAVGAKIVIKDYCIFGNNCSIMSSDHDFNNPLIPYAISGILTAKSISIGVNCWFGINVSILGNITIGHGCVVGANTLITKDIPPFSLVIGNPSKVIKRYNFHTKKWVEGENLDDHIFFNEEKYLEYLQKNYGNLPLPYHSGSSEFGDL